MLTRSKYLTLWLVASFVLLPLVLTAQNKNIDSLLLLLQQAQNDSVKVKLNFTLYGEYVDYDIPKSNEHLEAAYSILKNWNSKPNSA